MFNKTIIRNAVEADLPNLISLYSELNPEDDYSQVSKVKSALNEIFKSDHFTLFVLEYDGQLVSSCYLNIIPNISRGCKPYALIENVITQKAFRKHGFGSQIMKHAIEYARSQNCYKVMLLTGRKDQEVHKFYQALGFDGATKTGYQIRF